MTIEFIFVESDDVDTARKLQEFIDDRGSAFVLPTSKRCCSELS
jgi:hypothetical protein